MKHDDLYNRLLASMRTEPIASLPNNGDTNVHPIPESDPYDAYTHASYDAARNTGDALHALVVAWHASRQAWRAAQAMAQRSEHPTDAGNANTPTDAD